MVEFPETLLKAARRDSKISGARFWALVGVAMLSIACTSAGYVLTHVQASVDSEKLDELSRRMQRLTSTQVLTNEELAEAKAGLVEAKRVRQRDAEAHESQLEDVRQRLKRLEGQPSENSLLKADILALKTKLASLEKLKHLMDELVKSPVAALATPPLSYMRSNTQKKSKLPLEVEKQDADQSEDNATPTCLIYGGIRYCDVDSPSSQK